MSVPSISRRDILRTLAMSAAGGAVLQVIPLAAAQHTHHSIEKEKMAAPAGKYAAKYFNSHQYATLILLCDTIIPKDEKSGGALEGGAPEFIDLLTSENEEYQARLGGGLAWLDVFCSKKYSKTFVECTPEQQKEVLDKIAYRKNAKQDPSLGPGVHFFAFVRDLTCDAYYSSKVGIEDLQYIGNTSLREFPGCPSIPDVG